MTINRIDFAPPTFARTLYRTQIRTWFFICIGLALCASAIVIGLQQQHNIDANKKTLQLLTPQLNARNNPKTVRKKSTITETQANAVNTAIAQLNLPWRDVLDAMESATPTTIALLSLEPDARRNAVKGIAEAKDSDDMVRYIELLKKEDFFSDIFITMHEINQLDPNKPVRFQFEAHWQNAAS
ncbi:PilN domain-containing protein [Solimicrobium silvestre]|uniref:Fimbrial assembly protein (PilN) n=1 Tax=Solimicrobium silvestre TaxID=2099400 RepID=A0A2S9GYB7_9BURK|nr:PilN domain-containing protein [Solimicrobium silvestre]PRC92698.1 hypothetical protein S2091_2753 [Solimicrobium silvestre]